MTREGAPCAATVQGRAAAGRLDLWHPAARVQPSGRPWQGVSPHRAKAPSAAIASPTAPRGPPQAVGVPPAKWQDSSWGRPGSGPLWADARRPRTADTWWNGVRAFCPATLAQSYAMVSRGGWDGLGVSSSNGQQASTGPRGAVQLAKWRRVGDRAARRAGVLHGACGSERFVPGRAALVRRVGLAAGQVQLNEPFLEPCARLADLRPRAQAGPMGRGRR